MEPSVPTQLPQNAKCITCGYALYANTSARCPECGREFDPSDAATYDLGNSRKALTAVKWMMISRMSIVVLFLLGLFFGGARLTTLALILFSLILLAVLLTLYFQTKAAALLLGQGEALRYLFAALMLAPIWLIGPILIPSLVAIEVRKRAREPERLSID